MSKAEERALEVYPIESHEMYDDLYRQRNAYVKGYNQAEKDLELTCDDIEIIINAFLDYKIESIKSGRTKRYTDKEYCQEVLKRFKDYKERREK